MAQTMTGTIEQGMGYGSFLFLAADFSERELLIMRGEPVEELRRKEVLKIMKKAEKMGLSQVEEDVYKMYENLITDNDKHKPKYTLEEANAILKKLTPWED